MGLKSLAGTPMRLLDLPATHAAALEQGDARPFDLVLNTVDVHER